MDGLYIHPLIAFAIFIGYIPTPTTIISNIGKPVVAICNYYLIVFYFLASMIACNYLSLCTGICSYISSGINYCRSWFVFFITGLKYLSCGLLLQSKKYLKKFDSPFILTVAFTALQWIISPFFRKIPVWPFAP